MLVLFSIVINNVEVIIILIHYAIIASRRMPRHRRSEIRVVSRFHAANIGNFSLITKYLRVFVCQKATAGECCGLGCQQIWSKNGSLEKCEIECEEVYSRAWQAGESTKNLLKGIRMELVLACLSTHTALLKCFGAVLA